MNTQANGIGGYARKESPSGTGISRHKEEFGPGSTRGFWRWLDAQVQAGLMTPGEKQKRVMLGR